ncbi:3-phosphoshikimate 1-carboxyvinyltransferase [Lactiplantibacillus fabifermentans]|uniref:3-phosphoshikimate 1-carboxyvinyltransferase n=2 Tax=Lactiplantibacillus fabifermentans TaxID=483011 RepID=A0A0R2NMN8_9LACO|nr:3-phosphoshikimate 1-carboxyvinyltransferase [Lactiplantibacillus fabifermentans]ETY74659.1 3-phosphoshikimate 1-carboxyvinyltransferase [Lactiplantibacillus fabifermentans T30PCM01]KRO26098.1 3-phosphoshikimate 1-carboxyvinyltransferase [Lactiplantibacillus fabifermentans DSM 21115]
MKKLSTQPKNGLHGQLAVPGDKSISHRVLILGAVSHGTTTVHHFLTAADCLSTLTALRALGVPIEQAGSTVQVTGRGWHGLTAAKQSLDLGNAGTGTRLLAGLLAGQSFDSTLIGDASLSQRPMQRVATPLAALGAQIDLSAGHLPMRIHGQNLHATHVQMTVASAQVKSALILAALQADGPSTIMETLPTRDHTERLVRAFGGDVQTAGDQRTVTVQPRPQLHGQTLTIPGDMSSAAFFMTAAAIVPHSQVTLTDVGLNPTRTGLLQILQRMGGQVTVTPQVNPGEPLGTVTVTASQLRPITLTASDIPAVIDELPLVALLAATANGVSRITGAEELRYKETDRIATIVAELRKLGVNITALSDGFVIDGRSPWHVVDSQLASHGDHRIGMMLAIAALRVSTPLQLTDAGAVDISYPTFFDDLAQLLPAKAVLA